MQPKDNNEQKLHELTAKQKRFCEEYVIDLNATQACIRVGYKPTNAKVVGSQNLTKLNIKAYIAELLVKKQMTGDEAVKLIGDIAKTSLNDYFTIREVERPTEVKVGLQVLIDRIKEEMSFEEEYAKEAMLEGEEMEDHRAKQKNRQRKMLRLQIELRRNPGAFRTEAGEPEMIEQAELDLVKLVKDKEAGKIKSISYGQFGPKVEMYAADAALMNVAKITGKVTDKVDHTTGGKAIKPSAAPILFIPAEQLTPEQIAKYLADAAGPSDESIS